MADKPEETPEVPEETQTELDTNNSDYPADPDQPDQLALFPLVVGARKMTLEDYLDVRGWKQAKDDDASSQGYIVERYDLMPNEKGFEGFIFWVPASEFEEQYQNISVESVH